MKLSPLLVSAATVALLSSSALAWTNEDHEIFDIVSSLQLAEGKDVTFYTFMNTTQSATEKEISKAYRKRSLELHPDKNPGNAVIADRFARLGTIAGILRDGEKRKRYDHFHDNGVPKWRGSGYYYSRYRPGFGFTVACLTVFSCFIQYIFFKLKYRTDIKKLDGVKAQAIDFAWGVGKKPLAGQKRIQVQTGPGPGIPGLGVDESWTSQGSTLEMIVEGTDVYVVNSGVKTLMTKDIVISGKFSDTWIPQAAFSAYAKITGQVPTIAAPRALPSASSSDEDQVVAKVGKTRAVDEPVAPKKPKGPSRGVEGLGKIGGRRRKVGSGGIQKPKEA